MRVLFISSGNAKTETGLSPIIMAQGQSLEKQGINVSYYGIKGNGIKGYLRAVPDIRKKIRKGGFDVVHVHYGLSAFAVGLALSGVPIITSLMGSDVLEGGWLKLANKLFTRFFWNKVIVKSEDMKIKSGLRRAIVVPNGVDMNRFSPKNSDEAKAAMDWDTNKRHILFGSNPNRPEKNFTLFKSAFELLSNSSDLQFHPLKGYTHDEIPTLLNAADVVVLSSKWEGSPNVIKEAMSCNRTCVSTSVGDVPFLFGDDTKGCFISSLEIGDFSFSMQLALQFVEAQETPGGRQRIEALGLGEEQVAKRIIEIYKQLN